MPDHFAKERFSVFRACVYCVLPGGKEKHGSDEALVFEEVERDHVDEAVVDPGKVNVQTKVVHDFVELNGHAEHCVHLKFRII